MPKKPTPKGGQIWSYKDVRYRVRRLDGLRTKDPSDGNWQDAISYEREKDPEGLLFVRQLDDFLTKFEI